MAGWIDRWLEKKSESWGYEDFFENKRNVYDV